MTRRRRSPRASCQARMSSSPVSSPAAPAAGWRVAAAMPLISHSARSSSTRSGQPALGERGRGRGVDAGQAGQRGHRVADLRVVLHRARAERVGAEVDRELAVGEPGEVADQVALGHLGERHRLRPGGARPGPARRARGRRGRWCGSCQLARPGRDSSKSVGSASRPRSGALAARPPGSRAHRTALSRAATNPSISARVRRSVTATSKRAELAGPHRPVAALADQPGEGDPGQEALVGQPLDEDRGREREARPRTPRTVGVAPVSGTTPSTASSASRQ